MTSKSTRKEDERKMVRYARWGVTEYFLYDPRREYVNPPLRAFELTRGTYRALRPGVLSNGERGIPSRTLDLELWLDGSVLRFYDRVIGRNLLTPREEQLQAVAARSEADLASCVKNTLNFAKGLGPGKSVDEARMCRPNVPPRQVSRTKLTSQTSTYF